MSTSLPRPSLRPPVTRRFESTRLQNQSLALAYESLIPVISRRPARPRNRPGADGQVKATIPGLRSKAEGA